MKGEYYYSYDTHVLTACQQTTVLDPGDAENREPTSLSHILMKGPDQKQDVRVHCVVYQKAMSPTGKTERKGTIMSAGAGDAI